MEGGLWARAVDSGSDKKIGRLLCAGLESGLPPAHQSVATGHSVATNKKSTGSLRVRVLQLTHPLSMTIGKEISRDRSALEDSYEAWKGAVKLPAHRDEEVEYLWLSTHDEKLARNALIRISDERANGHFHTASTPVKEESIADFKIVAYFSALDVDGAPGAYLADCTVESLHIVPIRLHALYDSNAKETVKRMHLGESNECPKKQNLAALFHYRT
ncbi:hypothetical protein B0H13DRAFT_1879438 [Mycena leptocephala]|nr:hypothetical protein B0H13DRAFT_1879438 [Mycena leptocephala]